VNVPTRRSEPKRGQLMIIFTLLGGILATGIVLILPFAEKIRMNFSN